MWNAKTPTLCGHLKQWLKKFTSSPDPLCVKLCHLRQTSCYGQTPNRKWLLHLFRTEVSELQRFVCLGITGAMTMTPITAMEVLLGHTPLHMTTEAEAQARIYRLMYHQQCRPKIHWLWSQQEVSGYGARTHPTQMEYDRMLMRQVYHKTFMVKFPDKCEGQNVFSPDNKGGLVWYSTNMAPRPINALVLECTDGAHEGSTPSVLGSTPQYSRLNLYIIKACVMKNTEKVYTGRNIYILYDSQAAIMSLYNFQINPN